MTKKEDNVSYRELVKELRSTENMVEKTYTKLVEFEPVKKIVYTVALLVITTVAGAVISLVIIK